MSSLTRLDEIAFAGVPHAGIQFAPLERRLPVVGLRREIHPARRRAFRRHRRHQHMRPEEELFIELQRYRVDRVMPQQRL